ncbi:ABC transporter permease [Cellulomonas sp. PhB143]|uniref:ABC transporter permease n=1 Tax=Cellulomonas sp. PhB143 TaxID=2485186 RepID=UPI000FA23FCD|nr:ABC transporter permease [Cellulomonas sp. PhB143]ROS76747.1 monosaccharide ABC transporter membrane protein (CUT2 family) [Cellulomonas sp. PhB143]
MSSATAPPTAQAGGTGGQQSGVQEPTPARRRRVDGEWVRRNGVYLALLVLVVINVIITPHFVSEGSLRLQLVQVAPVVIVALGMAMVIGTEGIDLSVGAVMALSAALMPLYLGYGTVGAIVVGVGIGAVTGLVAGVLIAKVGVQPIVATLGIMIGGRGLAIVIGGSIKSIDDPGLVALGTGSFLTIPYTVLVALAAVLVVGFLVRRTTYGRQVVAIGGNRRASLLAGLPVSRVLITVYVVSGLLAAVAGVILAARSQASDPTKIGLLMELSAITAVVIGGTPLSGGSVRILGTVAGALVMQLITSTLISHNIPDSMAQMIQAAVVILAVYVQIGRKGARS